MTHRCALEAIGRVAETATGLPETVAVVVSTVTAPPPASPTGTFRRILFDLSRTEPCLTPDPDRNSRAKIVDAAPSLGRSTCPLG
jgi:hypothetical protein